MSRTVTRATLFEHRKSLVAIAVGLITLAAWWFGSVPAASAGSTGTIVISSVGLPKGQLAVVQLKGPSGKRIVRLKQPRSLKVPPGHYTALAEQVSIGSGVRGIQSGAVAYPFRQKAAVTVKAGARASIVARYQGIVNPASTALPGNVLGFLGSAEDPSAVLVPAKGKAPRIGAIYLSGPTPQLPRGLISRVTAVKEEPKRYVASLEAVPVTDAIPSLQFEGNIDFEPATGATSMSDALAHASSSCSPPQLLKFGAHLDSFQLRQASVDVFPPQMRLSLAIRSTESMGLAAAAAGINCNWTLAELGPFDAALPLGPLLVPVYATLPLSAGVHINGSLNAATINVASTTVASMAAGSQNSVSLEQQGSNVWTSGTLSLSGSAKLSASIGVQAGIGVAKVGNVHVNAGFGPEFEWSSGHECGVYTNLGSLSASVSVLGKTLDTPSWTPIRPRLWSGCAPGGNSPGGSKGGTGPGAPGSGSGSSGGSTGAPGGGAPGGSPSPEEFEPGSREHRVMITVVSEAEQNSVEVSNGGSGGIPETQNPACTGSGTCVVPSQTDEAFSTHAYLNTYAGGAWSEEDAPLPVGANTSVGASLGEPACAATDVCVVPGSYNQGFGMVEVLEGGRWSAFALPAPISSAQTVGGSAGAACSSTGVCVVPGTFIVFGSEAHSMLDTLRAGVWSSTEAPVPADGVSGSARLSGNVACSSGEHCLVTGFYTGLDGEPHQMIEELSSAGWVAIHAPVPPGGVQDSGGVSEPACSWGGFCVLDGEYSVGGEEAGMVDRLVGGSWTSEPNAGLPADAVGGQRRVTQPVCFAASVCALAGEYESQLWPEADMIEAFTASSSESVGLPSGGYELPTAGLKDPICIDVEDCVVVTVRHDYDNRPWEWLASSNAGVWSSSKPPVPAAGLQGSGELRGEPACSLSGLCVIPGEYEEFEEPGSAFRGMIAVRSSSHWAAITGSVPPDGATGTAIPTGSRPACSLNFCVLVGEYETPG